MPNLNNFFDKADKSTPASVIKRMHPQNINYKKLEESSFQYRQISQEDIEKLADLIEMDGEVLQPLLVRKKGSDTYEILAGHKRYKACKYLAEARKLEKFAFIPCYIKELSDTQAEFAVYSTNGYNAKTEYEIMCEIEGMERLVREHPEAFPDAPRGRMVERLSKIMGISKTVIQEYRTVSTKLGPNAMEAFKENKISKDSAKALASIPHDQQKKVIGQGLTKAKDIKNYIQNNSDKVSAPAGTVAENKENVELVKEEQHTSSISNKEFQSEDKSDKKTELSKNAPVGSNDRPTIFQIKLDSRFFKDKLAGLKPFELRENDRGYKVGDILEELECKEGIITGRKVRERITYMLEDYPGLEKGYCILGTKLL